jgi:hypothetical protein
VLWVIERVTPVRVTEATEVTGLDEGIHGGHAYVLEGAPLHL